ncbi:MAG: hypothetical protein COV31_00330 [Candidatus Yanofskybacteria bacterium CG10_big_fil_rev_8_21_14_0_10_46_23]|uniref:Thioredoxin domain-containing protein n=1 Tax=Candidatus Yanofskybacteria bacterium CG10_big_fil_rev_8_21_14_0_10_46_23 TaxID=1975098 RepID=A0A2H0R4U3_9BACT|nr:MAG: hypothetical protein COV31_00330 [Candidatus Yanofskybacteria bacterium CG10_big_fil_rev_8_21_14_0_10_46_23]
MKKLLFGILGAVIMIVILWGIFKLAQTPAVPLDSTVFEVRATDNVEGLATASVTLIEYSDFQCPACASYFPILEQLKAQFPNDLKFVYRHLPLISIHPNALGSAQAAEAAGLQGKFFEMHYILFSRQAQWSGQRNPDSLFEAYAQELGLNLEKFKEDLDSGQTRDRVNADLNEARALGLNATPTFFLNGVAIGTPQGLEPFAQLVQSAIEATRVNGSPELES